MARVKPGIPTIKEIKEGESEYRYINGTGLVLYTRYNNQLYSSKMHAASTPPSMSKKLQIAMGNMAGGGKGITPGNEHIRRDGSLNFTGHQSHASWDITDVGSIDVDYLTTLDTTEIDTSDREGYFLVSGEGYITLETGGGSGGSDSYDKDITIDSNSNVQIFTRDEFSVGELGQNRPNNTSLFSKEDATFYVYPDSGVSPTPTLKLFSGDVSAPPVMDARKPGHVNIVSSAMTESGDTQVGTIGITMETITPELEYSNNCILIQQTGSVLPGLLDKVSFIPRLGVDIRGDTSVRLRAEASRNGNKSSNVWIRAIGEVNIGAATSDLPGQSRFEPNRTKISGLFEFTSLYKKLTSGFGTQPIFTDVGWASGHHAEPDGGTQVPSVSVYQTLRQKLFPTFDGINPVSLSQAHTHVAAASNEISAVGDENDFYRDKSSGRIAIGQNFMILSNRSRGFTDVSSGEGDEDGGLLFEPTSEGRLKGTDFQNQGTVWMVTVTWYTVDATNNEWTDEFGINCGLIFARGMANTWNSGAWNGEDWESWPDGLSNINIRAPHKKLGDGSFQEELGYLTRYSTDGANGDGRIFCTSPVIEDEDAGGNYDLGTGIQWNNNTGHAVDVFASVLRLQSGDMFKMIYGLTY